MNRLGVLLAERLRRDGVQLMLWIGGTVTLAAAAIVGVGENFGTAQDRTALLATALANPVILLFRGLPSGVDPGAFVTFLILPFLAMLAAFMTSFLAVRHTRAGEESGLAELVSATPAGRMLPTVATAIHGVAASVVLGTGVAATFAACGFEPGGSAVVGAACVAVGVVFLALGLLAAQLLRTSRAANSTTVTVLLVTFFAAGIGNALGTPSDDLQRMDSSWLTWLSPFGWAENTRAFDDDALWPLAWCGIAAAALLAVAFALLAVRDSGSSLIAERLGRARARAGLASTTALVARLSWPSTVAWMVGGFVSGLLATALAPAVDQVAGDNPAIAQVLTRIAAGGDDLDQGLLVVFFTMIGILAACAGVQTVLRARQDEAHGTAELVRALPVGRVRWLADFLAVGFAAGLLTSAAAVAGAVAGVYAQDADRALVGDALVLGGGQVLAAGVLLALTGVAFTVLPRATVPAGWILVLLAAVLGLFGPLFGFPEWLVDASPFAATPVPEGEAIDLRGLWWLVAALAIFAVASLTLMRRRELAAPG